jgi:hypothetical protein
MRVLFAISMGGRLLFAAALPLLIPAPPTQEPALRRPLLLRVIGMRPSGGLAVRPLPAPRGEGPPRRES